MIVCAGRSPAPRQQGPGLVFSHSLAPAPVAVWAWLADTHVAGDADVAWRGLRPAAELERVASEIRALGPSGVLVNGDLSWRHGAPADYERFLQTLRPALGRAPLVVSMGNHDDRDYLLTALAGRPPYRPAWVTAVVDQPPYRLITLDSHIAPDVVGGELGSSQIAWLEKTLASSPARRTVVFLHHPGVSASEGCRDFALLQQVAIAHPTVQAIVTAHDHAFGVGTVQGLPCIALPATAFAFRRNCHRGWIEARLSADRLTLRFRGPDPPIEEHIAWTGALAGHAAAAGA